MMVYCISAAMAFNTAARRDFVRTSIEQEMAGRNQWGVTTLVTGPIEFVGEHGLMVEARFTSQADQQAIQTRADSAWSGSPSGRALPGSTLTVHACPHDAASPDPCVATAVR